MTATAYPLDWPSGWKRTTYRTRAKFLGKPGRAIDGVAGGWSPAERVTLSQGMDRLNAAVRRLGGNLAAIAAAMSTRWARINAARDAML